METAKIVPRCSLSLLDFAETSKTRQSPTTQKSCLKRQPLRDVSNLQEGSASLPKPTKRVNFIVEGPDRPSTLSKNRFRARSRSTQAPPMNDLGGQVLKIIDYLGDVNRQAFFSALRAMFTETDRPILANFQCGVNDEFLQYFWSIKWRKEDLSEDDNVHYARFTTYKTKFIQGPDAPDLDPTSQPTLFILRNPTENNEFIARHFLSFINKSTEHRLMIVGDVSLAFKIQLPHLWRSLSLTYFLVTLYDKGYPASEKLSPDVLAKSAGIPSLTLQLLRNERPKITDPIYFWINSPSKLVCRMGLRLFVTRKTMAMVNVDWTISDINTLDLARACGYLVAPSSVATPSTPDSSYTSVDVVQSPNLPQMLVWPECLVVQFKSDHSDILDKLSPKDSEVGWLLLEQITAQNMAKHHKNEQTLGERFPFLATSFVSRIKHEISDTYVRMPQVSESAPHVLPNEFTWQHFTQKHLMTSEDFWTFIKDVVPANQPLATRDKGATPDWMVKLVDGDKQHLLCFQLKSGTDEYSFEQILDELAKCPQVEIASKAYAYREAGEAGVKLTFVFGSISHAKVKAQLRASRLPRLAPCNSSALRVTHESWQKVPKNVEIIILLESGLRSLLGTEDYEFIKNYSANLVLENQVTALDLSTSTDSQKDLSAAEVKKLIEAYANKFSNFIVNVDVVHKTAGSPVHDGLDNSLNFPGTPIPANNITLLENTSPGAPEDQLDRGVKRLLEDGDEDEDGSARKKQKLEQKQLP